MWTILHKHRPIPRRGGNSGGQAFRAMQKFIFTGVLHGRAINSVAREYILIGPGLAFEDWHIESAERWISEHADLIANTTPTLTRHARNWLLAYPRQAFAYKSIDALAKDLVSVPHSLDTARIHFLDLNNQVWSCRPRPSIGP